MSKVASKPVSFDRHIRQLFRPKGRQAMEALFDLWSYQDVTEHADAIAHQLRAEQCLMTAHGQQIGSTSSNDGLTRAKCPELTRS